MHPTRHPTRSRTAARLPQRRNGIVRFNKLLDATERLIERMPVSEITLNLIATEADVPRVSAYHFFPGVDAVLASLYDRFLEEMLEHAVNANSGATWQEGLRRMFESGRAFYESRGAAMQLVLSPALPKNINSGNRRFGRAIFDWLCGNFAIEASDDLLLACEVLVEIVDSVWSKSYQEHRRITDRLFDESVLAATRYLSAYLPKGG